MKLVNRVSIFFLVALGVVLIVYSGAFYGFVRTRLVLQFQQELRSALHSLVAAVEVEPEEVKWQPLEHTIELGAAQGPDELQWVVIGDLTRVVEDSRGATPELIAQAKGIASRASESSDSGQLVIVGDWHILFQRLSAPAPQDIDRELDEFDDIVVVVARSAAPLNANLDRLLLLVCTLPVGTWLAAAAAGRWFCRRALQPVMHMSEQARSMNGANFDLRLPVTETRDELADLAVAFNRLLDHQHKAFEQQRRFTANAAHELRTPLTVLLGQMDVALRQSRSPEEYSGTLRLLRDQTAELQAIVEALLFLARSDEDANLPDSETFALAEWLSDYIRRWDEHPRRGDIRLQIDPDVTSQITASRALLARLLDNLIENALKYSSPGSTIGVIMADDNGDAVVEVQDQGAGIALEDLREIFQPFFRSRKAREAGISGTGLGLAIAARIASAVGGQLYCRSDIGRGTCFTLRLPTTSSILLSGTSEA